LTFIANYDFSILKRRSVHRSCHFSLNYASWKWEVRRETITTLYPTAPTEGLACAFTDLVRVIWLQNDTPCCKIWVCNTSSCVLI